MIRLQEKKLQVLREMRTTGAIDHKSLHEGTPDHSTMLRGGPHSRDAIERQLDAVVAKEAEDAFVRHFDTYFVERAAIQAAECVAAVKMLRIPSTQAADLTVLAYKSGRLEFYTSPLVKILEMTLPGNQHDVESIALEMYNRQPCLVVNHNAKMLSIFALHLTERARLNPTAVDAVKPLNQASVTSAPYELRVEQLGTAQLETRVTAFTLVEGVGRIVAGSEDGKLSVFSVNGTRIDSLETDATHIQAVASQQRRMAFSDASNFVITSLGGGLARTFIRCRGCSDSVTLLAFDTQQNDIIYAGTKAGDVLVFRFQWGSGSSDQSACQLLSCVASTARARGKRLAQVTLKVVKGYLLAAGPSELTVFNLSRASAAEPPSLVPVTALKEFHLADNSPVLFDFAQGVDESSLVYLSVDPTGHPPTVKLFHSFLTSPAEQRDFPWVFAMYMTAALAVVIAMQFYARRNPEPSRSPWDEPDLSHQMPFGKYGARIARPSFDLNRGQTASISSRIAQNKGKPNGYAVGDAFEEAYRYDDAFEEDESRPTYHSLRDELRQHLTVSARKQRV